MRGYNHRTSQECQGRPWQANLLFNSAVKRLLSTFSSSTKPGSSVFFLACQCGSCGINDQQYLHDSACKSCPVDWRQKMQSNEETCSRRAAL